MGIHKKVYAIVTYHGEEFGAHIMDYELRNFSSYKVVTKAEYQAARKGGMPSWGDRATTRKKIKADVWA